MKIGDNVTRKWKPALGKGKVIHLLGETVVVKWFCDGVPRLEFEERKYLKVINEKGS
jgi:hypothetical protein